MESPRGSRESVRGGAARHVSVAEAVHRDGEAPPLTAASPEIGGIEEGGAGGVELRYEGVAAAGERGLEGSRGDREVGRGGAARHVGVAEAVHRDAEAAALTPAPAEIGGIDECGAGGVELRYEGVGVATAERGLEGPQVGREVGRAGAARHIGVAESVHRDAPTLITPATARYVE